MFESSWFSVLFLSGEQGKPFRQPCGFTNICGWWKRYPKARVKFAACGWLASLESLHVDFKEIGSSLEKGKSSVFKETLQVFEEDFCSWNGFLNSPRIPSHSINEFLETIYIISSLGSLVTGAWFAPWWISIAEVKVCVRSACCASCCGKRGRAASLHMASPQSRQHEGGALGANTKTGGCAGVPDKHEKHTPTSRLNSQSRKTSAQVDLAFFFLFFLSKWLRSNPLTAPEARVVLGFCSAMLNSSYLEIFT